MAGTLHDLLDELTSSDRPVRERAAAHLGDILAATAKAQWEVGPVAMALVDALLAENDPIVQEESAHSLGYLVEYGEVPTEIVQRLTQHLHQLDPSAVEQLTDLLEESAWQSSRPEPGTGSRPDH